MPGRAACARRPVTSPPARSERSGEPAGLTGEHAWHPGPHRTDGPFAALAAGRSGRHRSAPLPSGTASSIKKRTCAMLRAPSAFRQADRQPRRPRGRRRPNGSSVRAVAAPAPGGRKRQRPSPARAETACRLGSPAGRIGRGRRRRPRWAASGSAWRVVETRRFQKHTADLQHRIRARSRIRNARRWAGGGRVVLGVGCSSSCRF